MIDPLGAWAARMAQDAQMKAQMKAYKDAARRQRGAHLTVRVVEEGDDKYVEVRENGTMHGVELPPGTRRVWFKGHEVYNGK